MLENVRGLATARFARYREQVLDRLHELGYQTEWQVLNASEVGVPPLRPRFILVATTAAAREHFEWPNAARAPPPARATPRDLTASHRSPRAPARGHKAHRIRPA